MPTMCSPSKAITRSCTGEVEDFLVDARQRHFAGTAHDCFEEADKGHGRLEVRRHCDHGSNRLADAARPVGGPALRGLGRTRAAHDGGRERRAGFLSLFHSCRRPALCSRRAWPLSRWKTACTGGSTSSSRKTRAGRATRFAAANLAALRKLALNAAKADKSVKDTVRGKLFRAAISDDCRLHLLRVNFGA
jgi:hypothetical protein